MKKWNIGLMFLSLAFVACKKEPSSNPGDSDKQLQFSLKLDPTQQRLNNFGLPADMQVGNAAQTPEFNSISIHYIELAPTAFTALGSGAIVYKGQETSKGGEDAVDFDKAILAGNGELFTEVNLEDVPPGTYEYVRTSVTYQNYGIKFNLHNVPVIGELDGQSGIVASFVGFNTYISDLTPNQQTIVVNDDKKQGFWAFETAFASPYDIYNSVVSGQSPVSATTVVNPLFQSSPIPAGSCVVTGKFAEPLVITGQESQDLKIILSYSINNSFEWQDANGNGELDFYADDAGKNEPIVDMGLRGLEPTWE